MLDIIKQLGDNFGMYHLVVEDIINTEQSQDGELSLWLDDYL